jgi:cobalt-zinc-cadmium efflux system protein
VAVLVVSIAIRLGNWQFLDPILSIAIALFILWNALKRIRKTTRIFLQSIPDDVELSTIETTIRQHTLVCDMHDTHVWSLDGTEHILSAHLVVPNRTPYADVLSLKCKIRKDLSDAGIDHATLEIEELGDVCGLKDCY